MGKGCGRKNIPYTETPEEAQLIGFYKLKGGFRETALLTCLPNPNGVKHANGQQVTLATNRLRASWWRLHPPTLRKAATETACDDHHTHLDRNERHHPPVEPVSRRRQRSRRRVGLLILTQTKHRQKLHLSKISLSPGSGLRRL